jgi:hypothetical protein
VDIKPISGTSGQYRISDAIDGEWMEYTVNVTSAGQYLAEFRVGNRDAGSTFHMEINGVNVTGTLAVPDTNSFDAFTTVSAALNLTAGQQVIRFVFDDPASSGYGAAFDWMRFTQQAEPEPEPEPVDPQQPKNGVPFAVGATPVTIQAEDFDLGGQDIAYNDTNPTSNRGGAYRDEGVDIKPIAGTSGQYRISDAVDGEWMEYTIDVATAGNYLFEFRVGNRDAGSTFHIEIGGVNVSGAMSVPDTDSFDSFAIVSKQIALSEGQQVVRFVFDNPGASGYGAAYDWMRISQA